MVCQFSSKCIVTSFDNFKKTKQVLTCENYLFNDSLLITTAIRSKNEIVSFIKWSSPSTGRTVDLHYSNYFFNKFFNFFFKQKGQNNFSLIIIPPREEIVYQLCFSSQDLTIIEKTVEMFLKKNPVVESPILIENINKLNFDISTFYIDHLSGLCVNRN